MSGATPRCTNHPDREALSFCHGCGKYYCATCLVEGREYYYCSAPACQRMLTAEQPGGNDAMRGAETAGAPAREDGLEEIGMEQEPVRATLLARLMEAYGVPVFVEERGNTHRLLTYPPYHPAAAFLMSGISAGSTLSPSGTIPDVPGCDEVVYTTDDLVEAMVLVLFLGAHGIPARSTMLVGGIGASPPGAINAGFNGRSHCGPYIDLHHHFSRARRHTAGFGVCVRSLDAANARVIIAQHLHGVPPGCDIADGSGSHREICSCCGQPIPSSAVVAPPDVSESMSRPAGRRCPSCASPAMSEDVFCAVCGGEL